MNQNISLADLNPMKLIAVVRRYYRTIVILVVVALFGYTGYQISRIAFVQPDQAYLTAHQDDLKVPNFKTYNETLEKLQQLDSSGDTTIPIKPGKQNPFSL